MNTQNLKKPPEDQKETLLRKTPAPPSSFPYIQLRSDEESPAAALPHLPSLRWALPITLPS